MAFWHSISIIIIIILKMNLI